MSETTGDERGRFRAIAYSLHVGLRYIMHRRTELMVKQCGILGSCFLPEKILSMLVATDLRNPCSESYWLCDRHVPQLFPDSIVVRCADRRLLSRARVRILVEIADQHNCTINREQIHELTREAMRLWVSGPAFCCYVCGAVCSLCNCLDSSTPVDYGPPSARQLRLQACLPFPLHSRIVAFPVRAVTACAAAAAINSFGAGLAGRTLLFAHL